MKILHIALPSHFTEGMLYQENVLIDMNRKDGHDTTIITDVYHYEGSELVEGPEEDRIMENGARIIRLKYDRVLFSDLWTEKIQKCRRLKKYLDEIQPDTILYHGVCGYEMMDVAKYCKEHPECLFYMDSHEDYTNSAMTFASKTFYKIIHGHFVHRALPQVDKILSICKESDEWLGDIYGIKADKIAFFPLGGKIYSLDQQKECRKAIINKYALPQDAIILAHSGKLSAGKKTADLIKAFSRIKSERLALFIFGSIPSDMETIIRPLLEAHSRIHFMGWKVSEEIEKFLAGVDLYCQPGEQSSTFETAMCCGCVNMTYPHDSYIDSTYSDCDGDNYFFVDGEEDMVNVFNQILENPMILEQKKAKSFAFAKLQFDYEVIARRIYQ
ncbi:glycosyltransferase family 4 protein [Pseudobutyrivibrio sp.]|uniref:glycosyltransferase family 4 protein n=1 Tax=Pseudobutyrivibrio sp. TaxID=2014367 RepID=UPI00386A3FA7